MKSAMAKKKASLAFLFLSLVLVLAACGKSNDEKSASPSASQQAGASASPAGDADNPTVDQLIPLAKAEGKLVSVGMPDSWANWGDTWKALTEQYGLEHTDTDMTSAEVLAKFENEKNSPPDIGDIGIAFGSLVEQKQVTLPYKTEFWDEIPDWAKDDNGDWMVGYTGAIAFICNNTLVAQCPKSWEDLKNGSYKVSVGDVTKASQAQHAVLAAAIAFGGSESNLQPGLDYFAKLAEQGRIAKTDVLIPTIQKGEVEVGLVWDFNALGYREQIDKTKFDVHVPAEGSVISGYASVINKNAKNPNAAMLARHYIFSDAGQINLAKGFARPIRSSVVLPAEVQEKLLPADEYANAKPVNDFKVWENALKELPNQWLEQVQSKVK